MKVNTLHTKFIAIFTLFIACISAGLYSYLPAKLEHEAMIAIATQSEVIVEMVANSVSPALFFSDKKAIEDELILVQKSPAIEFVFVRDNDGKILSTIGVTSEHISDYLTLSDTNRTGVSKDGLLYFISTPIQYEGAKYGVVTLGMTIQTVKSEIASAKQTITIILIAIFCIGFVLIYFLSSFITISLRKMVKTAEKIAEGDLSQRVHIHTKDEIGMLANALNSMVDNLHKALVKERDLRQLKTRFVNTISHEFRTPLTGISISTDILETYYDRLSNEQKLDEFHKIKQRVTELTDLMNDFLLHSSLESMRDIFTVTSVDLEDVVQRAITDSERIAHSANVMINVHFGEKIPTLDGDPKLLHHVVKNLISNAIKYSRSGGEIFISLEFIEKTGEFQLSIQDNGIGIPNLEQDKLFTQFYRATNTSEIPGTGLGLSIVKEFVELHNGVISVKSVQNEGTIFVVTIPLKKVNS
ncbi:MAG: HAMP domain-containing protein [Bacteroidetes bacterium]|nr:HAMP domain-containing protein [Bacteroidota bacterium]